MVLLICNKNFEQVKVMSLKIYADVQACCSSDTKAQEEIKHQIILCVENESNDTVRRKKADCLAELARKLFGKFVNF